VSRIGSSIPWTWGTQPPSGQTPAGGESKRDTARASPPCEHRNPPPVQGLAKPASLLARVVNVVPAPFARFALTIVRSRARSALESGNGSLALRHMQPLLQATKLTVEQKVSLLSIQDSQGRTPLHLATKQGNVAAVHEFGEAITGAGLSSSNLVEVLRAEDAEGRTAVDLAMEGNKAGAVQAFREVVRTSTLPEYIKTVLSGDLHSALSGNRAEEVRTFAQALSQSKLSPQQKVFLLNTKDVQGCTVLHLAMKEGHADAVRALAPAIIGLPEQTQLKVLRAADGKGESPLHLAMAANKVGGVRALGELIKSSDLSEWERFNLLLAPNERSIPVLRLIEGRSNTDEAVQAFREVVRTSTLPEYIKTVLSGDLHSALSGNRAEEVRAFAQALSQSELSPQQKVFLLNTVDAQGCTPLHLAVKEGHADTARAIGEVIGGAALSSDDLVNVLGAEDAEGRTALHLAMAGNNAEAVQAFAQALSQSELSPQQKVFLLNAGDAQGRTPLHLAMKEGHAGAVQALAPAIIDLPEQEQLEVLRAPDGEGQTPLHLAMAGNKADGVGAFAELLRNSGLSGKQKIELLRFKNAQDETPLQLARKKNHAEAVRALAPAIIHGLEQTPLEGPWAANGESPFPWGLWEELLLGLGGRGR
jgi:ankyrin repeat protein